MEQSLWQKVVNIEKLHQSNQKTTGNSVMWEIRLKIASKVYSKMLHLQVTCGIQNQRQEVHCAHFGSHTFLPISWMCKKQTAVSHSSAEFQINSLDARLRVDGLPALQFWESVLATFSSKPTKGNLERHKRERVIPSHSLSDNCVTFRPIFPTVHTQTDSTYLKTMRQ